VIGQSEIDSLCRRIVQHFAPERIVLFGSCATGTHTEASDVDLLAIMP